MIDVGDDAPLFAATLVTDDIEPFTLRDHLGDGPVVLAFFPAAFSRTCTDEMRTLRDDLDEFPANTTIFGISTDLPHALNAYREEYDLPFGLVADPDHEAIEAYDVVESFDRYGVDTVARRAVFVIGTGGVFGTGGLADSPGQGADDAAVAAAVGDR